MQELAQGAFTADEVRAVLHGPVRTVAFRYDLLDENESYLRPLLGVLECHVTHRSFADIPRTARLTLVDDSVNYLRHRVRPWMRVKMPDSSWLEWPLGSFLLTSPSRDGNSSARVVEAYDSTLVLIDDKISDRHAVLAGANVMTAVLAQFTAAGLLTPAYVASTKTLPAAMEWPPGTPRFRIVQDLLASINYGRVWFNGLGVGVIRPYVSPSSTPPTYEYASDAYSVAHPETVDTVDLFAVPNKWIGVVSEPDRAPLRSVWTNVDPNSPTSTVSRGRTVAVVVESQAVDQTTLNDYTRRQADLDSNIYRKVTFNTALMPHHEHLDVLAVNLAGQDIVGSFQETDWEMNLSVGGQMSHAVRLVVQV